MKEISIIICTYNRVQYINTCLNSLLQQSYDLNKFEIIVINNNSTDNTEIICKQFQNENPNINFIYKKEIKQGLSYARNTGIEVSTTRLIAFIDDDAIAEKDYVENLIDGFKNYPTYSAIGGKVLPIYPNGKEPVWMSNYIQRLVSKVDDGEVFIDFKKKYPVGCNMAFRKEIFSEIGFFNTDLTLRSDDKYIFCKLKNAKMKTIYAPNVIVWHNIESYRLELSFIKKLSRLNGHTERVRLKREPFYKTMWKLIDFKLKLGVSFPIALIFLLKGQKEKGKLLITVMLLSLMGFIYYKEN